MNPIRPYEIVAPMTVYEVLRTLSRSDRRRTEEFLGKLTRHPSTCGDFECPAEDGRVHQAKTLGNILVSYWPDHFAREIRLTGIERVE